MDDFEAQMREQLRHQSMDAAMDRRVERLGVLNERPTERQRAIARLMKRTEKKRARLMGKVLQSRPDDRAFSLIMNEYAENILHATGPYHLYPFYPGLGDLAPFMKPINSDGATVFSPWPVQQHLYLQNDFDAVKDRLTSGDFGDPRQTPTSEFALDYAPIPATQAEIEQGMALWEYRLMLKPDELPDDTEIPDDKRREWSEHGLPLAFGHLGTRIVSDRRGAHCLSIYTPGSNLAGRMIARPLEALGAELNMDGRHYPISLAIMSSTDHKTGETKCSWFAHQFDRMTETGFGCSARPADNKMYSAEERVEAEGLHVLLLDFYRRNIEMLMLPTYFALQVEEVEHLEPTQARELARSGGTTSTKQDEAPARKPSRFQIVKAVRKSRLADTLAPPERDTDPDGEKRAYTPPETQVEVPGFWRRVRKAAFGKGPDGEPVPGKTWVGAYVRYKDKPASDKTKVKEPLAPHMAPR